MLRCGHFVRHRHKKTPYLDAAIWALQRAQRSHLWLSPRVRSRATSGSPRRRRSTPSWPQVPVSSSPRIGRDRRDGRPAQDWPIAGGGDGIRRRIGTVGATSPLFDIEKTCRKLIPTADDPVAFAEALEEFVSGIARVDGMAYSSNFAGGSGKPSENSATRYIERSKDELVALKKDVAKMNAALGK